MIITYMVISDMRNAPDIGTYRTYSLAAYRGTSLRPVRVVRDVSVDAEEALKIASALNAYKLSPIHMKDAIMDMLE